MNTFKTVFIVFLIFSVQNLVAQGTDANLVGHVTCCGKHIPFANIAFVGTTIGTSTDHTGHYQIVNIPEGSYTVRVSSLGYKRKEVKANFVAGETLELKFDLQEDAMGLDEITVTGDRNETDRKNASTIVNTVTPKLFDAIQSVTLSEGLNFCSGLRMENNCQNCGFTQVRMNGLEGPYSQILINSRPIFSGLAGVYGLELIPSNMIERVEIIRGGGSALYGSNAIAGTINLILKDPINNGYEAAINTSSEGIGMNGTGGQALDYSINFNTSLTSDDTKTGMALYGFHRNREPFDANNDSFSEIAALKNNTIGTRIFHRFGTRSKLALDFFTIAEERRGGNAFEKPLHEADIAEAVAHNLTTGALTYEQFFREYDLFSVFVSGQKVDRESYYGAQKSLSGYGQTDDFTYTIGAQYNAHFNHSNLVAGVENNASSLNDQKLGYLDVEQTLATGEQVHVENMVIASQSVSTFGSFAQYDVEFNRLKVSAGARFDNYRVKDKRNDTGDKTGNVFSPRVTLKYDVTSSLQLRSSYSRGYRAPQIFDEDLHIETSGSRQVIHRNSTDLKQETSQSVMASVDFNRQFGKIGFGLLVEGFHTKIENPFANQFGEPNADGTIVYTRINAEGGAAVQGVNLELNVVPNNAISLTSGFTAQSSKYKKAQEFNEKRFFRTPENYGYATLDWTANKAIKVSVTGTYTGKMLVPYAEAELREVDDFLDLGLKVRYNISIGESKIQLFAGVKNIFNAYQSDFDSGINRDPAYIYGPLNPRTIYGGIKFGNLLD